MDEEIFNMSLRKFLKKVGITAQREIENTIRGAQAAGSMTGGGKVAAKADQFDADLDLEAIRTARTFRQFDGLFTAPVHGFGSAEDYWARASSLPGLPDIGIPTLLLNALDDPFLGPTCFPAEAALVNPNLTLLMPSHGGHVGFMQRGGVFWSEDVVGRFLDASQGVAP